MAGNTTNKRTKAQRLADQSFIEHWALRSKGVRAIAELLSKEGRPYTISFQQIHYDLKQIEKRWQESAQRDCATHKANRLAEFEKVKEEAWEAWEKSKQDAERKSMKQIEGGADGKDRTEKSVVKEGQAGDVACLRVIMEAAQKQIDLLGIAAPVRREISGPDGQAINVSQTGRIIIVEDNGRGKPELGTNGNGNGNGHAIADEVIPRLIEEGQ